MNASSIGWADELGPGPVGFSSRMQRGAELGERLHHAFTELREGEVDVALVLGSDTPRLTAAHIDAALATLGSDDVVLGPTADGGYWCMGLRRPAVELFHDIPWSTHEVFRRTLVRAHAAGLRAATAATLADLDTPHDVAMLVGVFAAGSPACRAHALAALRAMGMPPAWRG